MLTHTISTRVEWGDCDPAGIVFYPRYFTWVDASAHHLLEHGGLYQTKLAEIHGISGLVLGKVVMEFNAPGFFADALEITSSITKVGTSSFTIGHEIKRAQTVLATGEEIRIWALEDKSSPSGMAAGPIPDDVRTALNGGG